MADGLVVLGTTAIVGGVAVLTIALVYDRPIWLRGDRQSIEAHTTKSLGEPSPKPPSSLGK